MTALSEKQQEVLLDVRERGCTYVARRDATLKALEKRGLIERAQGSLGRAWELTPAGVEMLPSELPRTKQPVHTYWMLTERPDMGPHERDTHNGYVYRIYRVTDGVPHFAGLELENRIRDKYPDNWSWGLKGVIAKTGHDAARIAQDTLGDNFKGFFK